MNTQIQRVCVWAAPVGFVSLLVALLVAGWLPFPSPDRSPESVASYYRDHTSAIRLRAVLSTFGAALIAPIAAVIAVHLRRIEGKHSPLAFLELGMGCASPLAVSITSFFWWTAAFRPERDPVVTQSWHDAGWLCFTAVVFIVFVQFMAIAGAILSDRGDRPVFPRWLAYLSVWTALLLVPSVLCLWFKTGPFAWNGIATLYLALAAVGVWFVAMIVCLLRAIAATEAETIEGP